MLFYLAPLETVLHLTLFIHLPMKSYRRTNTLKNNVAWSSKLSQVHLKKEKTKRKTQRFIPVCSPSALAPWFPNTFPASLKKQVPKQEFSISHGIKGPQDNSGWRRSQEVSGQTSCLSKEKGEIRTAFSGHCLVRSWKPARTERAWSLWSICSTAQLAPWGTSFSLCLIWITVVQLTLCLSPSHQEPLSGWLMRPVLYNLLVGRREVWSLLKSSHPQAEQTPLLQPLPTGQTLQHWQLWGPSAEHVPIHQCLSSVEAPNWL